MYRLSKRQLAQRTFGPRTETEGKSYREYESKTNIELERQQILKDMTNSILDGDKDRVKMLVKKYHIFPSDTMLKNELMNRKMTKKEQGKFGVKEQYQMQRGN
jgi:DNA-binding transcriptional regulator YbjK